MRGSCNKPSTRGGQKALAFSFCLRYTECRRPGMGRTFALYSRIVGDGSRRKIEYEKPYQHPLADPACTAGGHSACAELYAAGLSADWPAVGVAADGAGGNRRHDDGPHGGRHPGRRVRRDQLYPGGRGQERHGRGPVSGQPVRHLCGLLCGPRAGGLVRRPDFCRPAQSDAEEREALLLPGRPGCAGAEHRVLHGLFGADFL